MLYRRHAHFRKPSLYSNILAPPHERAHNDLVPAPCPLNYHPHIGVVVSGFTGLRFLTSSSVHASHTAGRLRFHDPMCQRLYPPGKKF